MLAGSASSIADVWHVLIISTCPVCLVLTSAIHLSNLFNIQSSLALGFRLHNIHFNIFKKQLSGHYQFSTISHFIAHHAHNMYFQFASLNPFISKHLCQWQETIEICLLKVIKCRASTLHNFRMLLLRIMYVFLESALWVFVALTHCYSTRVIEFHEELLLVVPYCILSTMNI